MKSQLDLNLLKVLPLLDKYRQLKPVAKSLGKTESAVSKYLAKLREQLGDPLFVRGAFQFEPTEYTISLIPKITAGLDMIDDAVQRGEFVPSKYDKTISVAIPGLGQSLVGKALLMDLIDTFPLAKINITSWNETSIADILDDRVDIGVQYFNADLTKTIFQQHLGKYKGAIICSKEYADRTLEEKLAMPYIMMEMKGWQETKAVTHLALEEQGIEIDQFATVDNITCLFDVLDEVECATLLPYTDHTHLLDKYSVTVLPDHLQLEHIPSVVANYKLVNHGNPLHRLLASKLKQHFF